jgi:hypothetical protein
MVNSSPNITYGPLMGMIAPLSGQSQILQKAHVTNGIREVKYPIAIIFYLLNE